MEEHLLGRHCYVLFWRGCDHTPIEHHSYVIIIKVWLGPHQKVYIYIYIYIALCCILGLDMRDGYSPVTSLLGQCLAQ